MVVSGQGFVARGLAAQRVRSGATIASVLGFCVAAGCAGAPESESSAQSRQGIIFGADNRLEYGQLTSSSQLSWARATGALFSEGAVSCAASSCSLSTLPLTQGQLADGSWLELCQGERLRGQPNGARCTAMLVGPDLVATAGHCIQTQAECEATRVVFGFTADANGQNAQTTVPSSDVYNCVDLVAQVFDGSPTTDDWALFRVDRAVSGRTPLTPRHDGMVPSNASLVAIGHPHGVPLKLSSDGQVRDNLPSFPKFSTTLDVSPGNSGSPVIDANTGLLEGVLSSGPLGDWVAVDDGEGGTCAAARQCSETEGCVAGPFPEWTNATRIAGVVAALEGRSCHDDELNGQETDVDCGGAECGACALGQHCQQDRDCPFRAMCEAGTCVPAPECHVDADCDSPQLPDCAVPLCVANECQFDYGACECTSHAECDDGIPCTEDICFGSTRACIHIPQNCPPACNEETAIELGVPGNSVTVPTNACLRVRDGYPFWWGEQRMMLLQTQASGTYPIPFTWRNDCAGTSGSGEFTGNWQSQTLGPTNSNCATLISLGGNGSGNVSLWYFGG